MSSFNVSEVRQEHGVFMYRYEQCQTGNYRRIVVVTPQVMPVQYIDSEAKLDEICSLK